MSQYKKPKYGAQTYECPNCHVVAHQVHADLCRVKSTSSGLINFQCSTCDSCSDVHIWKNVKENHVIKEILIYPQSKFGPKLNEYTPDNAKKIFEEARNVYTISPRSSFLLLRVGLELLCDNLNAKGKVLDDKIENLINEKIFDDDMTKMADIIREVGNKYAHHDMPEEYTDEKTIIFLIDCINHIVTITFQRKQQVDDMMQKYQPKERPKS